MSDWLGAFVRRSSEAKTVREFATRLRNELNLAIPAAALAQEASGFHVCGYNESGLPEFWCITNIGGMDEFKYMNFRPRYAEPSSDFLDRDARDNFGWNGTDIDRVKSGGWLYRNGDYRPHALLWDQLSNFISGMSQTSNFSPLREASPNNYAAIAEFKLEVIAYFYKTFAQSETIGTPIDAFALSKAIP